MKLRELGFSVHFDLILFGFFPSSEMSVVGLRGILIKICKVL